MRKTKTVKIDDLEITVKELRVKDVRRIANSFEHLDDIDGVMSLLPLVTDLPAAKIEEMAPSELAVVIDAAKDVNSFFLKMLDSTGIIKALKASVTANLTSEFAKSSHQDTSTA